MNEKRKAFETKFEVQIEAWNPEIVLPKDRAKKATAGVKSEYYKTIEILQHRQEEAMAKLHELKTAGDEAWESLKTRAEVVWAEAKSAFHDAISKIE